MSIRFGPAGLGPVKTAEKILEEYSKLGLKACEVAFTYSAYIKNENDAKRIGAKAKKLDIELSVHAPYFINLNSAEPEKIIASKKRILESCRIGELLGAKVVVFHPGFYGKTREEAFEKIKTGIQDIQKTIKEKNWKIKLAPETMGKINVFGSVEEISKLVEETDCEFCIDFAHILAREKKVDFEKIKKSFPQKNWHCHFSGIVYGEKGEKHHIPTKNEEWKNLLENIPKDKNIRIINESPNHIEDSVSGQKIWKNLNKP